VRSGLLRGVLSVVCELLGAALFLFSIAVAYGWDRGPLSVPGTIVAILGLSLMFAAYWLVRATDGCTPRRHLLKTWLRFGHRSFLLWADFRVPSLRSGRRPAYGILHYNWIVKRLGIRGIS
jgi:hypothetical protein